jgi:hypothetical protein
VFFFLRKWDYVGWSVNLYQLKYMGAKAQTYCLAPNPTYSLNIIALTEKEVQPNPNASVPTEACTLRALRALDCLWRLCLYNGRRPVHHSSTGCSSPLSSSCTMSFCKAAACSFGRHRSQMTSAGIPSRDGTILKDLADFCLRAR